jgi:hypothetical protein
MRIFWLRFCILYYFAVSYAEILRFYKKKKFDRADIGGDTNVPLNLRIEEE